MQVFDKILVATDIEDFTLKSSFLPLKDLEDLLEIHDRILSEVTNFGGKILKNSGDGYLIVFDQPGSVLKAFDVIFSKFEQYNKDISDKLYQIKIRVVVHKGKFTEKITLTGKDYIGTDINILHRILDIMPSGYIYVTQQFYEIVKSLNDYIFLPLGSCKLKGIKSSQNLYICVSKYNLTENGLKILEKKLSNVLKSNFSGNKFKLQTIIEEVDDFIFKMSSLGVVFLVQPLPFLDISWIFILQIYMVFEISRKYGFDIDELKSYSLVLSFLSCFGYEYIKNWLQLWFFKIGIPFLGGYLQIPLAFGMIYGFGKLVSYYYYNKILGKDLSFVEIKKYFIAREKDGIVFAKKNKDYILNTGNQSKEYFLSKIKEFKQRYEKIKKSLDS